MDRTEERFRKGAQVSWVGIISNVLLALFKLIAGIVGRSQAMLADAVESLSDVAATVITLVSLRISRKPVDWDHPYGHGRAESIATGIVALLIALAGVAIIGRTVYSISVGEKTVPTSLALIAAVVTIVVKEGLYQYVAAIARRFKSSLLMASAADHRKDAMTTIATLAGIFGARNGFPILDPIAAAVVSVVILRLSYRIAGTAGRELMDRLPEDEMMRQLTAIAQGVPGVEHGFVRARRLGPNLFVEAKIDIDPDLTVVQGHAIAKEVKEKIIGQVEEAVDVMVHVNPHYD